jgi:huntingtin
MDSVGLKKLHHIQELLDSHLNVFYQPNMERIEFLTGNDIVSCRSFQMNQFALNYTWQMIETNAEVASAGSQMSRNIQFFHENCGIDFKSALQLIYDLVTQMIDDNPMMVLPQLAKLIEILNSSDQFKWISRKMMELVETIASEDTISHQYIVYLLCRSYAVLVPSLSELQQLQSILNKYLGSNQMFVRNATLQGLLCLFESLIKTNTTIGGMSDELILLRNIITGYTTKNGIVFERYDC